MDLVDKVAVGFVTVVLGTALIGGLYIESSDRPSVVASVTKEGVLGVRVTQALGSPEDKVFAAQCLAELEAEASVLPVLPNGCEFKTKLGTLRFFVTSGIRKTCEATVQLEVSCPNRRDSL